MINESGGFKLIKMIGMAKEGRPILDVLGQLGDSNSPIRGVSSLADAYKEGTGAESMAQATPQAKPPNNPSTDAMERRLSDPMTNPGQTIQKGIDLLDHPDVPHEVKVAAAPYLYGAQIFGGPHQAIDDHILSVNGMSGGNYAGS